MPGQESEREEIRPVVPASVHPPAGPVNTLDAPVSTTEPATGIPSARPSRNSLFSRRPLLVLSTATVVVLLIVFTVVGAGRGDGRGTGTARIQTPTATMLPTATPTVLPTPTIQPGFQLFVDNADGFFVQYPVSWTHRLTNPGAEFADNANTFEMQVLLPSDSAASGLQGNPNDPESWVNFAMQSFASLDAGNFQQDAGPFPAATFAGTTWKTARGLITDQVSVQVQVYATVYQGKPYIIALYAADGTFNAAEVAYFKPMRQSFEFLPSAV